MRIYAGLFGTAAVTSTAMFALATTKHALAVPLAGGVDLAGPFLGALAAAWTSTPSRAAFRAHVFSLAFASTFWGIATTIMGLALASTVAKGSTTPSQAWLILFATYSFIAFMAMFPARFSKTGVVASGVFLFVGVLMLGGDFVRAAPFRALHIGGLNMVVTFKTPALEADVAGRCRVTPLNEPHVYRVYVLSTLGDEVWYRCRPRSVADNDTAHDFSRRLDRSAIEVDDDYAPVVKVAAAKKRRPS
jgi:hypothetical protein